MTARDVHLLSGAYVLHAVTDDEAVSVEAAMAESEELRNEVVGLADTAVALGLAVPQAAPPPALRSALLAAIEDLPQFDADPAADTAVVADARPVDRHVAPRRRRRLRRPVVLLTAGVAAVLLFGGGVVAQRVVIEPQLEYSRIVAAPDAQPVAAGVFGGGTLKLVRSEQERSTAVSLQGVRVPAGHVLQLWTLRQGRATSQGLYEVGMGAQGDVIHAVPADDEQFAVTVEPAGGSAQPTTKPIVAVALS